MFSDRILTLFEGMISRRRFAGSYVFSGPLGSGVRKGVRFFAQGVNCKAFSGSPCGACRDCALFEKGLYVDFSEVDPEKSLGVDAIREVISGVAHGPNEGGVRIVAIYSADLMSVSAQNAMLKTLEEPPANTIFILETSLPMSLLATIRSRSHELVFTRGANSVASSELPEGATSFSEFLNLSSFERMGLAQSFAGDKRGAQAVLSAWVGEIWEMMRESGPDEALFGSLEKIVEKLAQMKYNLNLRLHLESLFLGI